MTKITNIIYFPQSYTKEHNEKMKLLIKNLEHVAILTEGSDADLGDYMEVAISDKKIYDVIKQLSIADCLYIE